MSKVVIFNGSPRKDGNTSTILQMIERGAKEHNAEVRNYTLFKMKMSACQGCFGCRINDGDCVLNDELKKAIDEDSRCNRSWFSGLFYADQRNG